MRLIYNINEGLDLIQDPSGGDRTLVRITDLHQDGLDISLDTNPVCYDLPVYVNIKNKKIKFPVISIFKRKPYYDKDHKKDLDGNPALYALKKEKNYDFFSDKDKKLLMKRFEFILNKIFKNISGTIIMQNRNSVILPTTGITVPSTNELTKVIVDTVHNVNPDLCIITDVIRKLYASDVYNYCCHPDSKFRTYWREKGKSSNEIWDLQMDLADYLSDMPDDKFRRHLLPAELRPSVLNTLEISKKSYKKNINGKDILLFDDTLTYGHTLEETINIIYDNYNPKSITILTLFSKKFNN